MSRTVDGHVQRLRRQLFSTRDHATTVIADRALLRRYQRRRSLVAVGAGLIGGLGAGISLSHSGAISAEPEIALGLPTLVGVAIALTFIYVRLPEVVRWVMLAAAAMYFLVWKVDLTVEIKLAAAVAGVALSWFVAHVLQFGIGVAIKSARLFASSMAVVAIVTMAAAALVTAAPSRVDAQSAAVCGAGEVSLEIVDSAGVTHILGHGGHIDLDVPEGGTTFTIDAASSFDHGTVTVELIETAPIPLPGSWFPGAGSSDRIVWVGHLGEDGAPAGQTGPVPIEIRRRSGDLTYSVLSPAHESSLHLVAGTGRYRATVVDAASGGTCFVDAQLRILASPVTTPIGIAGLAGAVAGLSVLGGALVSGSSVGSGRPRRPVPWRPLGRELPDEARRQEHGAPTGLRFEVAECKRIQSNDRGDVWRVKISLQVQEAEHDVYEVEAREPTLLQLIDVRPVVVFPGTDVPELTIQVRTDPTHVDWRMAGLTLDVSSGGVGLASEELLVFGGGSGSSSDAIPAWDPPTEAGIESDQGGSADDVDRDRREVVR